MLAKKLGTRTVASRLKLKPVNFMDDKELLKVPAGDVWIFDVECYANFFYIAFKHKKSGKVVAFEQSPAFSLSIEKLNWMLWRFCIVGFNSRNYDLPMITLALTGATAEFLKQASDSIIKESLTPWQFEKKYKLKIEKYNHIDLIEVAPLQGSLKLYGGRLHSPTMQDLPFPETHILSAEDAEIVRPYCCNDLDVTEILFDELASELKLRNDMTKEYGVDLRSKSDAQIAEAVVNTELQKVLGYYPKRPRFDAGLSLRYSVPDFISYESEQLKKILKIVASIDFYLDGNGSPIMPKELEKMKVEIGGSVYKLGMGGLHSQEKQIAHYASEDVILADNDVASYYPNIILNQGLFPAHLGEAFLEVYSGIVQRRLAAKANGDKVTNQSLKITINGSFGKFGNKYSTLYAPHLLLQVTITGQLALLMLIEMLEAIGIEVVSGNTDGIVSKYHKSRHEEVRAVIAKWEEITSFETEETRYAAIFSRDVNSYIALKTEDGKPDARFVDEQLGCKTKGTYSERGSALNSVLSKNPEHLICTDAVLHFLRNGTPVEETVGSCPDVRRFITVRNVRGGGEKDGVYLGKVVRWYYAKGESSFIAYAKNGNKVAKSDGARPLMDLPTERPADIDLEWYIRRANEMLEECGAIRPRQTQLLRF